VIEEAKKEEANAPEDPGYVVPPPGALPEPERPGRF
jgi:hypothetical protein